MRERDIIDESRIQNIVMPWLCTYGRYFVDSARQVVPINTHFRFSRDSSASLACSAGHVHVLYYTVLDSAQSRGEWNFFFFQIILRLDVSCNSVPVAGRRAMAVQSSLQHMYSKRWFHSETQATLRNETYCSYAFSPQISTAAHDGQTSIRYWLYIASVMADQNRHFPIVPLS